VRYPGRRWPSAHTENRCRHNREWDDDQGQASCSIAWASSPVSPRCHRLIIASPSSFVRVVVGKGVRFSSASICRPAAPLSAGARRTPPAFHLGPTRGSCGCVSNRPRSASVPPASPGRVRWRLLATPLLSGRSQPLFCISTFGELGGRGQRRFPTRDVYCSESSCLERQADAAPEAAGSRLPGGTPPRCPIGCLRRSGGAGSTTVSSVPAEGRHRAPRWHPSLPAQRPARTLRRYRPRNRLGSNTSDEVEDSRHPVRASRRVGGDSCDEMGKTLSRGPRRP
jgi:hypothetical protein